MAINAEIATRLTVKSSAFNEKMKRAGQSVNKLGTQTTAMGKKMARASAAMKKFGKVAGVGLVAGFAAAGLAAKKFINVMQETFASVDVLAKTSRTLSISLQDIQAFGLGAQLAGLSVEVMNKAITRLAKNVGDIQTGLAQKTIIDAFEAIGISTEQLQSIRPTATLKLVADGLANLSTKAQQVAIAFALFGRQGPLLLNLLADGSAGISKLQRDFQSLGTNISFSQANRIEIANDAFVVLNQRWENFKQNIGAGIADTVTQLFNEMGKALSRLNLDKIVQQVKSVAQFAGREAVKISRGESTANAFKDVVTIGGNTALILASGVGELGASVSGKSAASDRFRRIGEQAHRRNIEATQRLSDTGTAQLLEEMKESSGFNVALNFIAAKRKAQERGEADKRPEPFAGFNKLFDSVRTASSTERFNREIATPIKGFVSAIQERFKEAFSGVAKRAKFLNTLRQSFVTPFEEFAKQLAPVARGVGDALNATVTAFGKAAKQAHDLIIRNAIRENVAAVQQEIDALTNKRLRDLGATGSIGTAGLQRGSLGSLQASIAQVDDRLKRDQEAQILAETERMADLLETIATNTRHPNIELADLN